MDEFVKHYAIISDMGEDQVIKLLEIQDKQDTKYSRVKTCKELWNILQGNNERLGNVLTNESRMRQYYVDKCITLQNKLEEDDE